MGAQSEINLLLATITRRLDQLTKPTFDRATVEELLAEIFRLRSAEHRGQIAKEIAWRDGKIDEQSEELDEKDEELEGLQELVVEQTQRIADLEMVNATLSRHLSEALLGSKPGFRAVTDELERMTPAELRRKMETTLERMQAEPRPNRVLPMRPGPTTADELRAEKVSQERADLRAQAETALITRRLTQAMVLSDDGLAVFEPTSRSRLNLVPTKPERD